jgi:drug/metabolite transporter (DMT)-like permease
MNSSDNRKYIYIGIGLAILATLVWSGNFVVARGVFKQIPPISLAFFRWLTATVLLAPFALQRFAVERKIIKKKFSYLFWTSLTGIALFNTFVYIAGHYSTAINMALIGTTSSPIIATILAAIFLREKTGWLRIIGIFICITGILVLISKGSWLALKSFQFSIGDGWVLLGALMFAIYNTLAKKKPVEISPVSFLFAIFALGTILLSPFFIAENRQSLTITQTAAIEWNISLVLNILYLGLGTSVISFLCWNAAIARLGAARTALFGNLIPIFSSLEAVVFLGEKITPVHYVSGLLVIGGLLLANIGLLLKNNSPVLLPEELPVK